jgi:hypothetical protein
VADRRRRLHRRRVHVLVRGGGGGWLGPQAARDGNSQWQRTYGGTDSDGFESVQQTSDLGYVVAGTTRSFGAGDGDMWVIKLHADGEIDWQHTFGGDGHSIPKPAVTYADHAESIQQTSDGGYLVVGSSYTPISAGEWDGWVVKLLGDGSVHWEQTIGGDLGDRLVAGLELDGGRYVAAGWTGATRADMPEFTDAWVITFTNTWERDWHFIYDTSPSAGYIRADGFRSIVPRSGGGFVVVGNTGIAGPPGPEEGDQDGWIVALSAEGAIEWQSAYGDLAHDEFNGVAQTVDGGYVIVGSTQSHGEGGYDVWVLKIDANGGLDGSCSEDLGEPTLADDGPGPGSPMWRSLIGESNAVPSTTEVPQLDPALGSGSLCEP